MNSRVSDVFRKFVNRKFLDSEFQFWYRTIHCSSVENRLKNVSSGDPIDNQPKSDEYNKFTYKERIKYSKSIADRDHSDLIDAHNPDSFGLISRTNQVFSEKYEHDEDDQKEEEFITYLPLFKQKLRPQRYVEMIKEHIANKRLKEAIDVLEVRMLKEDRAKPESFIYNLLIGGCAEFGYTWKAFKLFSDMKKRGLKVSGGVYTSLFNACANSPWKADGLLRATNLNNLMIEKGIEKNLSMYNAMIKAFGRCGDIKTAFKIVDELNDREFRIRVHTFNFLLQASITDKESGFRHALITWRKMLQMKEKPNIYSFNLMLKCIKECGFNSDVDSAEVIKHLLSIIPSKLKSSEPLLIMSKDDKKSEKKPILNLSSGANGEVKLEAVEENSLIIQNKENDSQLIVSDEIPNLLSRNPNMVDVLSFGEVKTAQDRFVMVGGTRGILREMKLYNVQPDIKVFTQLIMLAPQCVQTENELISSMKEYQVKFDIDFYNMLIKKRCMRSDYESAKTVLDLIKKENKSIAHKKLYKIRYLIRPNVMTYGVLALYCCTKESAQEFVKDIKEKRIKLNSEILGTLLNKGLRVNDIDYIKYVIELTKEEKIKVNDVFLSHLKKHEDLCHIMLHDKVGERGLTESDAKNCKLFLKLYKTWKDELKELKHEEPAHPWEQFRVNQPETFQKMNVVKKKRYYKVAPRRTPKYVVKI